MGTSLLEAVQAEARMTGTPCSVAVVRAALQLADAKDLDTLLADPDVMGATLSRALTNRGHRLAAGSIQRHRRGDCRCER